MSRLMISLMLISYKTQHFYTFFFMIFPISLEEFKSTLDYSMIIDFTADLNFKKFALSKVQIEYDKNINILSIVQLNLYVFFTFSTLINVLDEY